MRAGAKDTRLGRNENGDTPWVGGFQMGLKDEAGRDYGEKGNGGQARKQ